MRKQQGAEDKRAIRDSLNAATAASAGEGREDPPFQLGDKTPPPPPSVPAGAGICQPHAAPRRPLEATRPTCAGGGRRFSMSHAPSDVHAALAGHAELGFDESVKVPKWGLPNPNCPLGFRERDLQMISCATVSRSNFVLMAAAGVGGFGKKKPRRAHIEKGLPKSWTRIDPKCLPARCHVCVSASCATWPLWHPSASTPDVGHDKRP